jgi:hypothetical protein
MAADLQSVIVALANLTDSELNALIDATKNVPQAAPGLLAWLEAACDWESNRRTGRYYDLQPPGVAIAPAEDAVSVDGTLAIRYMFGPDAHGVHALLDVLTGPINGAG